MTRRQIRDTDTVVVAASEGDLSLSVAQLRMRVADGQIAEDIRVQSADLFGDRRRRRLDNTFAWDEIKATPSPQPTLNQPAAVLDEMVHAYKAMQTGDIKSAAGHYETAVSLDSNRADAWLGLASCRLALGETAGADEAASRAVQLDPLSRIGHLLQPLCADRVGCSELALAHYYTAIGMLPASHFMRPLIVGRLRCLEVDTAPVTHVERLINAWLGAHPGGTDAAVDDDDPPAAVLRSYHCCLTDASLRDAFEREHHAMAASLHRDDTPGEPPVFVEERGGNFLLVPVGDTRLLLPHSGIDRYSRPDLVECFDMETIDEPSAAGYVVEVRAPGTCVPDGSRWILKDRGSLVVAGSNE